MTMTCGPPIDSGDSVPSMTAVRSLTQDERALLEEYWRNTWRLPEFATPPPQAIIASRRTPVR